ncbi:MAG: hypothetical protein HeimC3_12190 [Candidatus Heimdallarchaeota archaeon LC_3]|nr:MAG: hypothetical protein HeimC3_12190 [Candidatus Heimdallarchaeota archaeon LC_3]
MKKKILSLFFVLSVFLTFNVTPGLGLTQLEAYEEIDNTMADSFVKLQGHAVYVDSPYGGATDWRLNIKNYVPNIPGVLMRVYNNIYISSYYKEYRCVIDFGERYCSYYYYWGPPPTDLVTLSSDYQTSNGPGSVGWTVGLNAYVMTVTVSSSGDFSTSHSVQNGINGDYRDLGYIKVQEGFWGAYLSINLRILINLHIANNIAKEYDQQGHYEATTYEESRYWILKLRVKIVIDIHAFSWQKETHTYVLGDGVPAQDLSTIDLLPGNVY